MPGSGGASRPGAARVLIVLPDTAASPDNERVLGLHRDLASAGLELRTVALGPGGDAALDPLVPVLAPGARSLAAVLQLRREQRWADVVAVSGPTAAGVQALGGSRRRRAVVVMPRMDNPVPRARTRAVRAATVVQEWIEPERWMELFCDLAGREAPSDR